MSITKIYNCTKIVILKQFIKVLMKNLPNRIIWPALLSLTVFLNYLVSYVKLALIWLTQIEFNIHNFNLRKHNFKIAFCYFSYTYLPIPVLYCIIHTLNKYRKYWFIFWFSVSICERSPKGVWIACITFFIAAILFLFVSLNTPLLITFFFLHNIQVKRK